MVSRGMVELAGCADTEATLEPDLAHRQSFLRGRHLVEVAASFRLVALELCAVFMVGSCCGGDSEGDDGVVASVAIFEYVTGAAINALVVI